MQDRNGGDVMKVYTVKHRNGTLFSRNTANSPAEVKLQLARNDGLATWEAFCRFRQFSEKIKVYGHTIIIDWR